MLLSTIAAVVGFASVSSASYSCNNFTLFNGPVETDIFWVYKSTLIAYNATTKVPAYCDIQAKISNRINVWAKFPVASSNSTWNGRFTQYGCGGGCGYNPFVSGTDPSSALISGYAVSTTDMGMSHRKTREKNTDSICRKPFHWLPSISQQLSGESRLGLPGYSPDGCYIKEIDRRFLWETASIFLPHWRLHRGTPGSRYGRS
jgi:hypothetical protein